MQTETVMIGNIPCGDGHPPVFVAEIGSFFKKDMARALDFLARIVDAGAPVFKTEILHSADVILPGTGLSHTYNHAHGKRTQDYRQLIEERVVPLSEYERLFEQCHKLGAISIASVFDLEGLAFLKKMGAAAVKLSRNYANHHVLIRACLESGMPLIMDIGEVYFEEIQKIVEIAKEVGGQVIINHHPGANPSPAARHNLKIMETYKREFGTPAGLSCHYRGDLMLYTATAMGANILEKGVVDDPDAAEADIVSACRFSELPAILANVRESWECIGDGLDWTTEGRDLSGRAGMVARQGFKAGDIPTLTTVGFAWPPLGITSDHWQDLQSRPLALPVAAGEPITWAHYGLPQP